MSIKNREEAQLQVATKIVPTVTNAVHVDLLNNDILNSVMFRKDVIASYTGSGQVGLDFSTDDLIVYTLDDTSVLFTINGMENGDLKYLRVIKDAGDLVTFENVFDFTEGITYSKETDTEVFYAIYKKNNISFVKALSNTIVKASAQDFIDEIDYKFVTPKGFNDQFEVEKIQGTFVSGWAGTGDAPYILKTKAGYDTANNEWIYDYRLIMDVTYIDAAIGVRPIAEFDSADLPVTGKIYFSGIQNSNTAFNSDDALLSVVIYEDGGVTVLTAVNHFAGSNFERMYANNSINI